MIQTGGCWQRHAKALSTISCILFDIGKRERNKNKGMKEKKKEKSLEPESEKELFQRNTPNQRPMAMAYL